MCPNQMPLSPRRHTQAESRRQLRTFSLSDLLSDLLRGLFGPFFMSGD